MTETGHEKTFSNTVAEKGMKILILNFLCLIVSVNFHSAMGRFHYPTLVGNY